VLTALAAGDASTAGAPLPERDPQVGVALSLLQGQQPAGIAWSSAKPRVIGRLDAGDAAR
jgi:hypothetical protein